MWFITVMVKVEPSEYGFPDFGGSRTWGYYKEKDNAIVALNHNWTDIWEYCYDFAVLEKMDEGVPAYCEERYWFKYDKERNGYFEIEEPGCVKHLFNFAIG